jgi:hypothetical protein
MSCGTFRAVVNNTSFARQVWHDKYGNELLHAAVAFRSRVLAEGLECLILLHRSFAAEPHATMLFVLFAGCPACPVATTCMYNLCFGATRDLAS